MQGPGLGVVGFADAVLSGHGSASKTASFGVTAATTLPAASATHTCACSAPVLHVLQHGRVGVVGGEVTRR